MAILDNYTRPVLGLRKNSLTGVSTQVSAGLNALLREGTGRRRKPSVQDSTPYRRKSQKWSSFYGMYETVRKSNGNLESRYEGYTGIAIPGSVSDSGLRSPTLSHSSNIEDIANLNALKKFNDKDMDLGTAWWEREKAMNLVAGVAMTGVEALKAIKAKNGKQLLDVLGLDHHNARGRGIVDANLAYHYGMKPLLNDVRGATEALARMKPDQWDIRNVGYYRESGTIQRDNLSGPHGVTMTNEWQESCRVTIWARQRSLTREDDLRWALGLDDPLSTAWEIIPYSFVVDWTLPIGDWLAALNSIKYYEGWTTCSSARLREEMRISGGPDKSDNFFTTRCRGQAHGVNFHLNRRILTGPPMAVIPIKNPASLDHMQKALSLLASHSARSGEFSPIIRY